MKNIMILGLCQIFTFSSIFANPLPPIVCTAISPSGKEFVASGFRLYSVQDEVISKCESATGEKCTIEECFTR